MSIKLPVSFPQIFSLPFKANEPISITKGVGYVTALPGDTFCIFRYVRRKYVAHVKQAQMLWIFYKAYQWQMYYSNHSRILK